MGSDGQGGRPTWSFGKPVDKEVDRLAISAEW